MLKGFDVRFWSFDADKPLTYHFLWADSIWNEIPHWREAYDVSRFDVMDCETGEIMYVYSYDDTDKNDNYICKEWKEWGLR